MSALAHDLVEMSFGPIQPIMSKSLRAQFVAAPGHKLVGGDFSNIEGRINAWFAGEEWKLEAFRAYDRGEGPDLYKHAVSNIFGIPVADVTKLQRQKIGKTSELAFGYQGSIGAWLRFDPDPTLMSGLVRERFYNTAAWFKAAEQHDRANRHYGLSPDQWISIKLVVNMWRESNSRITQGWWDRQDAAIEAVDVPGAVVELFGGKIKYLCSEGFLWCRLPSGKLLAYCKPRLVETKAEYLVDAEGEMFPIEEFTDEEIIDRLMEGAEIVEEKRRIQVEFDGKNQKTGAWGRQRLYGGLQCNNDVQGTARELLRFAMCNVDVAGYPIVFHVHDELVAEVLKEFGSANELQSLMSILPDWLRGLPLACKTWEDARYVK